MNTYLSNLEKFLRKNPQASMDQIHKHLFGTLMPAGGGARVLARNRVSVELSKLRRSLTGSNEALHGTWVYTQRAGKDVRVHKQYKIDSRWVDSPTEPGDNGQASVEAVIPTQITQMENTIQTLLAASLHTTNEEVNRALKLLKPALNSLKRVAKSLEVASK